MLFIYRPESSIAITITIIVAKEDNSPNLFSPLRIAQTSNHADRKESQAGGSFYSRSGDFQVGFFLRFPSKELQT
jgi:hypothetical protein